MSEGTSPSGSYDEGSRSTPSNLPKVATRTRKKKPQIQRMRIMWLLRMKPLQGKRC